MAQNKDSEANNGIDEKDIKISPIFIDLQQKQSSTESQVRNLEKELQSVKERWALSKGDILTANKTIRSLEEKHQKRLKELSGGEGPQASKKGYLNQAKLVMELEHKLKHALDNVRQSESIRVSLADAHCMNDTLQRQIVELKGTNEDLKSEQNGGEGGDPQDPGISKEKLQKMKKDISELKYKCEVSPMRVRVLCLHLKCVMIIV
jgi:chromosome segregation ATPase